MNCFIFARGGSKGIPNKNLMKIRKSTLVGHSINFAKKMKIFDQIFYPLIATKFLRLVIKVELILLKAQKMSLIIHQSGKHGSMR